MNKTVLTFDIGNSNPHVGFFIGNNLEKVVALSNLTLPEYNYNCVFSNVGRSTEDIELKVKDKIIQLPKLSNNFFLDMVVNYENTLGQDRLYQAYYLYKHYENETVLLIDAGTFITIDLITKNGFRGGYIFPGINTYLSCYSSKGANLPSVNKKIIESSTAELGTSTPEAISNSFHLQLSLSLSLVIEKNLPKKIVITGGVADTVSNMVQKQIELRKDEHLIHRSLHYLANIQ